jgi:hypothetical protein
MKSTMDVYNYCKNLETRVKLLEDMFLTHCHVTHPFLHDPDEAQKTSGPEISKSKLYKTGKVKVRK